MGKRFAKHKIDFFLLSALILALLAGRWLLKPGYFNMHDDLQLMRQLAMEECIKDFQIPCRWTRHMGYGFGFPLFNYYPPFPYIFGEIFRLIGFSFINTVKLTFLFSFLASGATMYLFAKEFWGRLGGLVASAFYTWAPYHSVDVFVRGAMNEAWSLSWFPLILWSSYKFIQQPKLLWMMLLSLGWFLLFITHNIMVIIFTPFFAVWLLFWIVFLKKWNLVPSLLMASIFSLGLAGFFTIPVLLERNLVHIQTLIAGYYEYIAHFTSINQLLFSRFWGYGPSVWMVEGDRMSFQIGHLHWILSIVALLLTFVRIVKRRKLDSVSCIVILFVGAGWFAAFMTHNKSTPLWQLIPPLSFVQFPWRFLTLVILAFSFVSGSIFYLSRDFLGKQILRILAGLLVLAVVLLNNGYFRPKSMGPLTDEEKFSGEAWRLQQTAGIYDYLPISAKTAPKAPQKVLVKIIDGEGMILNQSQKSNQARFTAVIESENALVQIGILKFPNWMVFVDGRKVKSFVGEDDWGRMHIRLSQGKHEVFLKLENTLVRTVSNWISVVSWAVFLLILFPRVREVLFNQRIFKNQILPKL